MTYVEIKKDPELKHWKWSVRGRLRNPVYSRGEVLFPVGHEMIVGFGACRTRRGALRQAKRVAVAYCVVEDFLKVEVDP